MQNSKNDEMKFSRINLLQKKEFYINDLKCLSRAYETANGFFTRMLLAVAVWALKKRLENC